MSKKEKEKCKAKKQKPNPPVQRTQGPTLAQVRAMIREVNNVHVSEISEIRSDIARIALVVVGVAINDLRRKQIASVSQLHAERLTAETEQFDEVREADSKGNVWFRGMRAGAKRAMDVDSPTTDEIQSWVKAAMK